MSACSGRNYNFRCIDVVFLACFCASQRVRRRKAELILAQIREKLSNSWADWHQIWHTCANSYGNGYTTNKLPLETQGWHLGDFRGSTIQTYGEAVRLTPTLVHVCGTAGPIGTNFGTHLQNHLGLDIRQTNCSSRHKGGTWGVLGVNIQKSGKAVSNGWTDWHQLWFTSADSSGNGHRLNTSRPSIPKGTFRGGGGRGSQIQKSGEAVKRLDRLAPNLVHVGGFVWEWT